MRNHIVLDSSMRSIHLLSTLESRAKSAQSGTASYKEILEAIQRAAGKPAEVRDTTGMTLAEYKEYISDAVHAMKLDESRGNDTVSIEITDGGFRAMQSDPMYEQWVMDSIRSALLQKNQTAALTGGSYVMLKYGRSRDDYRAESWGKESQALFNGMSATNRKHPMNSFWMRRTAQMTQNLMLTAEIARRKIQLHTILAQALGNTEQGADGTSLDGEFAMRIANASTAYWMFLFRQNLMGGFGF